MREAEELRNFWKDKEKVEKVEKSLLNKQIENEENTNTILKKENKIENEKIEINFKINNDEDKEKRKFILAITIFIILFIVAVVITFIVIDRIKELKIQNQVNFEYMKD